MFYELIIGLGILVYVIWKYVLSTKTEKYVQDAKSSAVHSESVQSEIKKNLLGAVKLPLTRSVSKTEEKLETSSACPHVPKYFETKSRTSSLKNIFELENKQEKSQSRNKVRKRFSKDLNGSVEDSVDHKTERLIRDSKNPEEWVNDLKKYFKTKDSKIEDELRSLSSEIVRRKEKNNDINIEHYFIDTKNKADDTKNKKVNKEPVKSKPAKKHPTLEDFVRVQNDITIEPTLIQLNSISREKEIPQGSKEVGGLNEVPIYEKVDELFGTNSNELKLENHCEEISQPTADALQNGGLIPPSELLKRQREKSLEKIGTRESPPKERFAEFLEKTILSDDKIQSIIQNLSLDKTENFPQEEQNIAEAKFEVKTDTISNKALKLQASIDLVADTIQRLNDRSEISDENGTSLFSESTFKREKSLEPVDYESEDKNSELDGHMEEKPLLKRIQKQSGFPAGLNFGSVIGELKNKTKNGGLKPVFKKFDSPDTIDNAQACFFPIFLNVKRTFKLKPGSREVCKRKTENYFVNFVAYFPCYLVFRVTYKIRVGQSFTVL